MVGLHEELDMAHQKQQKLDRTVKHVQSLKEMQEKLTLSVLKSRAVDSDIIEVRKITLPYLALIFLDFFAFIHRLLSYLYFPHVIILNPCSHLSFHSLN